MKTENNHISNQMADFVIDRDIFGQIKSKGVSVVKKFRYKPVNAPELNVKYVNIGIRTLATSVDLVLIVILLTTIETFVLNSSFSSLEINSFRILIGIVSWIFYNAILESSVFQATIGEMLLSVKVVDLFGKKVGFLRAMFRCISTILSILPFGLGIWYITTDPKKQGWHDLIAGTFVIKK